MTEKKRAAGASSSATLTAVPRITEEELQRRIAAFKARVVTRIAGPDDPIYKSGLTMTSVLGASPVTQKKAERQE